MSVVLLVMASLLFGTTGATQALAFPQADPVQVGALRIAVGGALLGLVLAVRARRRPLRTGPVGRRTVVAVLAGAAGVVVYQPAFFLGVRLDGVAIGTLLALGSAPVFTGLLGWLVLRERPTRRWLLCTAMATTGIALLSGLADGGALSVTPAGALASLLAGAAYAVYTLAMKGLLTNGFRPLDAAGAVFGVAGIAGVVELGVLGAGFVGVEQVPAALWLGAGTIAAAYLLFARALERLPAATVSTVTLVEPVLAALLGVLLLHERLTPSALLGTALLVGALGLLGAGSRRGARPLPQSTLTA